MNLERFVLKVTTLFINPVIGLMITFAVIVFTWGLLEYVREADNPEKRTEGSKKMIWGIIGLTIMVSSLSLLRMVASTIGTNPPV